MLAESQGLKSSSINSWGNSTQCAGALIQLGLFESGEAEILGLTKASLFCMKQVESCCDVDLMVFELAESNDLGQSPSRLTSSANLAKRAPFPLSISKSQLGVGRVMPSSSPS